MSKFCFKIYNLFFFPDTKQKEPNMNAVYMNNNRLVQRTCTRRAGWLSPCQLGMVNRVSRPVANPPMYNSHHLIIQSCHNMHIQCYISPGSGSIKNSESDSFFFGHFFSDYRDFKMCFYMKIFSNLEIGTYLELKEKLWEVERNQFQRNIYVMMRRNENIFGRVHYRKMRCFN